eukprot:14029454-Alexandrium_andersonii.AAC.1
MPAPAVPELPSSEFQCPPIRSAELPCTFTELRAWSTELPTWTPRPVVLQCSRPGLRSASLRYVDDLLRYPSGLVCYLQ